MYHKFFDYLVIVNSYFDSYRYVLEIRHVYDVGGKIFNNPVIFSQQFVHIAQHLIVYVIMVHFALDFMVE